ncbi:MAG: tetrahydromethanopterin synthesis protein [gamma proteobacterium symbiont of Ctena orbiculata]|nr:MAG: tetrahydromethanopterin synthesis protein [gamma proteobacterium symbiont of Ctena orbiculata]PVV20557.1 MAG: tetrahydromethanopterin synthesis protein [gamma proteobacterium symbiont of Ctena orbiculata]PVV24253.1 MAG: tetrahydromethanopterin synthesis protein [gamma proteobacterium symbiont of Ctena orbiculata]
MIHEVIVTCRSQEGEDQIAPMGVVWRQGEVVIAPFRPSRTLDNILGGECAVINYCDDVRVFAGCLTGRYDWPLVEAERVAASRLVDALAHSEVRLLRVEEDQVRPRLICKPVYQTNHRPFQGFNRAQSAVLELAILVSRLERLPAEKIDAEIAYLTIAIDKTAGEREREAWDWLMARVAAFQKQKEGTV